MNLIGYARVSSTDQNTDTQVAALTVAGCAVIRTEKVTVRSRDEWDEFATDRQNDPVLDRTALAWMEFQDRGSSSCPSAQSAAECTATSPREPIDRRTTVGALHRLA